MVAGFRVAGFEKDTARRIDARTTTYLINHTYFFSSLLGWDEGMIVFTTCNWASLSLLLDYTSSP